MMSDREEQPLDQASQVSQEELEMEIDSGSSPDSSNGKVFHSLDQP